MSGKYPNNISTEDFATSNGLPGINILAITKTMTLAMKCLLEFKLPSFLDSIFLSVPRASRYQEHVSAIARVS